VRGAVTKALLLAVFGLLVTAAVCTGGGDEPPSQAPPDTTVIPADQWRQIAEELASEWHKPHLTGPFHGFIFGQRQADPCLQGRWSRYADPAAAKGYPVYVDPAYLPPGAVELAYDDEEEPAVVACNGVPYIVIRQFSAPGGTVLIRREINPNRQVEATHPAHLVEAAQVAGKPAVLFKPAPVGGLMALYITRPAVILAEDFGVTIIRGEGVALEELLRIAERLR
jgi:hypothetical protein